MQYCLQIEENNILVIKKGPIRQKALRISYDCQIEQLVVRKNIKQLQNAQFYTILGIKAIQKIPFLVIVKQRQTVCIFQGRNIYEIKAIDWIPLTNKFTQLITQNVEQKMENISKIFQLGLHYYSDSYHMHKPFFLNRISKINQPFQVSYYQQFIWNENILNIDIQSEYMSFLFKNRKQTAKNYQKQKQIFLKWSTPIIQGYTKMFEFILSDNEKIKYLLISRRSHKKAGARFYSRGVDDFGNSANYTQTQFIVQYKDFVLSNIQLRGSVPVFFEQIGVQGINIELNIQRSKELTKKPFIAHFTSFLSRYNHCMCVNLLTKQKKSQLKLSNFYEQMIQQTKNQLINLQYQFFDFHQQCRQNKFENTEKLIIKLQDLVKNFGFTSYNLTQQKIIKYQTGVFRTNCLDCLDRTNYVQSRIALQTFKNILYQFESEKIKKQLIEENLLKHIKFQSNSELLNNFNLLWGQNGDSVSFHYTGIGSTHTDITKKGKRTLVGTINHKIRSLMRFYAQFTDAKKHETINAFLGNASLIRFNSSSINSNTKQQNILIMSWQFSEPLYAIQQFKNNPLNSKPNQFLIKELKQGFENKYAIIVFFLYIPNQLINWQSGIQFDIMNLLNQFNQSYFQIINEWSKFLTDYLQSQLNQFVLIDTNEKISCKMMIFAKKNKIQSITNIKKDQILSNFKTNQVVLLTKFKFYNSPLVFQGYNVKNVNSFCDFVQKVNEKGFQQKVLGRGKSTSVNQQSYRLILGNIGSESKLSEEQSSKLKKRLKQQKSKASSMQLDKGKGQQEIPQLITKGCENDELKQLLESSQLMFSKSIRELANYNEPPLEFIPSNNRILFWNEEGKIVRAKAYRAISSETHFQFNENPSFHQKVMQSNKKKGIEICCPIQLQQRQKQFQSCVYLEISYDIEEVIHQ